MCSAYTDLRKMTDMAESYDIKIPELKTTPPPHVRIKI